MKNTQFENPKIRKRPPTIQVGVREKEVEQRLVKEVQKRNGISPKFVSPGMAGMPDRLVLLRDGRMGFVELKAPGKKMRPLQVRRKSQLETLGYKVFCVDGVQQIENVLNEIEKEVMPK